MNFRKDLSYLFLLLGFGIVFWWEALAPGKLLFLRDLSIEILARKHFWAASHGFALWNPFVLFGSPYATPQSGAFYPFNFLFLIFGAERGLTYYIIFHHLFFLLTFYLALRRIGYKEEPSLLGAVGFGLGGYMISTTLLVVSLSTFTWLGLIIIFLNEAQGKRWLISSLLLGLVIALQILGGEIEIAAMSWVLAFCAVALAPQKRMGLRNLIKMFGTLILGLVWGVILSFPQIAIAMELIPISNRAGGMNLSEGLVWSLPVSSLKSFLIPNYTLDASVERIWDAGYFIGDSYYSSLYLAVTLLPMYIFAFPDSTTRKRLLWLVAFLFGLAMMMGDSPGVYGIFHEYFPGFNIFRIPQKFFLLVNFAFVMLAISGFEFLNEKKWSFPQASLTCFFAAIAIIILLLVYPLRIQDLGDNSPAISAYLLRRSIFRVSMFFLIMLGLILVTGKFSRNLRGILFALVIFLDLFFAHHWINQPKAKDFFKPDSSIQELLTREKDRIDPPRIFSFWNDYFNFSRLIPFEVFEQKYQDSPKALTAVYFGYNSWQGLGTFYPEDVDKFTSLLNKSPHYKQLLARAGVEYFYYRYQNFEKFPDALSRAMVFYRAQAMASQDQAVNLWSQPDFPADKLLLIEGEPERANPVLVVSRSEPARIVEYQNEKVTVEAEADEAGWLLLLDSYYPGWEAEVDGKTARIYRADGFFRAVRIPAGKHKIIFNYFPGVFKKSVWVSGLGFIIWLGLVILTRNHRKEKEKVI
jgi:hypothetical protein